MITMNVIKNQIKCIIYHDNFHLCYVWALPSHDSFLFSPKVHFLPYCLHYNLKSLKVCALYRKLDHVWKLKYEMLYQKVIFCRFLIPYL